MIPPSPTINDAIGLLAALSNPARAKAMLDEVKKNTDIANEAFAKVQAQAREIEEKGKAQVAMDEKLGRDRVALAEDKDRHETAKARDLQSIAAQVADITAREAALQQKSNDVAARENALTGRENAHASNVQALNAREGQVVEREVKANALMETFKPIMDQLR